MQLRHRFLRSEAVNTRYGMVALDARGYVTNLDKLQGDAEQFLAYVPGFMNADLFPQPDAKNAGKETEPQAKALVETVQSTTDEQYGLVIRELVQGGAALNSQGYVDMGALNTELRNRNMKILSGGDRIRISDQFGLRPGGQTENAG